MSLEPPRFFYVDPSRCIGCNACVQACSECDTHKGFSMIQLDYVDRYASPQTAPMVCMHCESPTCAEVCPANAILRTADGVVQSARKPRCIACNNCVLACPFGVPKMNSRLELMMKCDQCYDRTSVGKLPMCASVCPSQALFFGTEEEVARLRPNSTPINHFQFGNQMIRTRVRTLVPKGSAITNLDVLSGMHQTAVTTLVEEDLFVETMNPEADNAAI
jgi:Fe-S-cluster-containing dehydrogenase component